MKFLIGPIIVWIILNLIAIFGGEPEDWEEMLNPKVIYKNCQVNIFGCIMLTLFMNTLLLYTAIIYWFYKLCTFGREDDE